MTTSPLIDARSLAERARRRDWIIVDCRFNLLEPRAGRAAYEQSHIPGARYADLDRDLSRRPSAMEGRHPLPTPAAFAATLGSWGIGRCDTVVAYDDGSAAIAARLWWLLRWLGHERALVLDGGFAAWSAAALPVESQVPTWQPKSYDAPSVGAGGVVSVDEIAARQAAGGLLVDVRAAARYRGEQEPIDPVAGHVPGAVNRPFSANVDAIGKFRAADALRAELIELLAGRDPTQLIAMCGSGVTACHLLLAMDVAGLPGGALFAGSWSEWIRDSRPAVTTGPLP